MKLFHIIGFLCWCLFVNFIINLDLSTLLTVLFIFLGIIASIGIRYIGDRIIKRFTSKL